MRCTVGTFCRLQALHPNDGCTCHNNRRSEGGQKGVRGRVVSNDRHWTNEIIVYGSRGKRMDCRWEETFTYEYSLARTKN